MFQRLRIATIRVVTDLEIWALQEDYKIHGTTENSFSKHLFPYYASIKERVI